MTLLAAVQWHDAPASPAAAPLMAGHEPEHDRLYDDGRDAPSHHSRRTDRSAMGQVWRSLNARATPNQVRACQRRSLMRYEWMPFLRRDGPQG